MVLYGVTKTSFAIAPAIELGGRVPMGALLGRETILLAYLVGGAAILPDNNLTMTFSFTGPLAVAGGASAVFASPPVLGMVDDAIMLELVLRELQHELDGYEEFDAFRRAEARQRDKPGTHRAVSREDWLQSRREALHARIRERRERDLAGDGEAFRLITRF